jgi:hypothetical protein
MDEGHETVQETRDVPATTAGDVEQPANTSKMVKVYSHPWTQILLISFICFCLPGVRVFSLISKAFRLAAVTDWPP